MLSSINLSIKRKSKLKMEDPIRILYNKAVRLKRKRKHDKIGIGILLNAVLHLKKHNFDCFKDTGYVWKYWLYQEKANNIVSLKELKQLELKVRMICEI